MLKPWAQLSADEKKLFIRQVEVFAAYAAYSDHEIGRVIQAFQDLGRLENTLMQAADRRASEQMDHFVKAFDEWRGETPQVDDLLLVSVVPHACWRTVREAEQDDDDLAIDAA